MNRSICIVDMYLARPPFGGPHTFLLGLARGLTERGWTVTVLTQPGRDNTLCDALRRDGLWVVDDLWGDHDVPTIAAGRLRMWSELQAPAFFLISGCASASWLVLPGLSHAVRTVSVAHHDVEAYLAPASYYARFLDAMVGVSETITTHLREGSAGHEERCRYVPYGVHTLDPAAFAARVAARQRSTLQLGFVGRTVQPQKRILWFPRLLARLRERGVDFHFHVVGDGPERSAFQDLVRSKGLTDRVTLHGWLSGEALSRTVATMDVLLLLSDTEGLPLAMLEAMGHGCVPVVSDIDSGMRNVVRDSENGFLVPFDDLDSQCAVIRRLDRDRDLLARLGQAAWETSQGYTTERMVAAYDALFQELLEGRLRRPETAPVPDFPPMPSCRSKYPLWLRKVKARLLSITSRD